MDECAAKTSAVTSRDLVNNLTDMEDEEGLSILERQVGQHLNDAQTALERKVGEGRNELKALEDNVRVGKGRLRTIPARFALDATAA